MWNGVFELKTTQTAKSVPQYKLRADVLKYVGFALISFFVANAKVMGSLSPFGVALTAAAPAPLSYVSFVGSLTGYLVFGKLSESLPYLAALLFVLAVKQIVRPYKKLRANPIFLAVMTGAVSAASGIVLSMAAEDTVAAVAIKVLEAVLAAAMTLFCALSCKAVFSGKPIRFYDTTEAASTVIVGMMTVIALCGVEVYGNSVGRILAVFFILGAAYCGGISGCAVISISAAVALALYNPDYAVIGGIYVAAGFIAAVFRPTGKIGQLSAFILVNTFGLFVVKADSHAIYSLLDVLIGTTLFMLVPERVLSKIHFPAAQAPAAVDVTPSQGGISAKLDFASKTLLDLRESIGSVSRKMDEAAAGNIAAVYDKTADHICRRCGLKMFCWDTAYNDVMKAFHQTGKELRIKGKLCREEMPVFFTQKCCKLEELTIDLNHNYQDFLARENANRRVSDARAVAIEQFNGVADMLCEVSKELAEITSFDPDAQEKAAALFAEFGEQPASFSCMIDKYDRMCVEVYSDRPFRTNLNVLTEALSESLKRSFELPGRASVNGEEKLSFFEKATYRLEFFAAQQTAVGGQVCGDCYEYFQDGKGFAHMILSDGMGSGSRAAVDSVMTCNLFLKLIKAGFGFESALKLLNSSLLIKSSDESLATLDVGCVDLYTGQIEFRKAGAVNSFVRRGGVVSRIGSASLPVGILQGIGYDRSSVMLEHGDLVVMVSDGVLETGAEWVEAELELYGDKSPKELAEGICREAQRRRIDGHSDDITVLAARLKRAG